MAGTMKTGVLWLVGTPIGNLGDIAPRTAQILQEADIIYCEDTRHSRPLLTHLGITGKSLVSFHEHNERDRINGILTRLADDQTVAVISDAGMPVISDPGQSLVAAVAAAGYRVSAAAGPNAALTALAISGLAADRFVFEGFLPAKGSARQQGLQAVAAEFRTCVLYESPHHLKKLLNDLADRCDSSRKIVLARELTKLHEEVWRGSLAEAIEYVNQVTPRGEYTVIVAGAPRLSPMVTDQEIVAALGRELTDGLSRRAAVDRVCAELGAPRKRVYSLALQL